MTVLIRNFVRFTMRFYRFIVLGAVVLTALGFYIASGMIVDSGMENLLPANSPVLKASQEMEAEFGGQDNVLVVVQGPGDEAEAFLGAVALSVEEAGVAKSIYYRIDTRHFENYAHLYLDSELYRGLNAELLEPGSAISVFLDSPDPTSFSRLLEQRLSSLPADQRLLIIEKYAGLFSLQAGSSPELGVLSESDANYLLAMLLFGHLENDSSINFSAGGSNFLVSDNGDTYLMLIKPAITMENYVDDRAAFFTTLQSILDHHLGLTEYSSLEAGYTGGQMVIDYEGDNIAFDGFISTALITIVLILILITLSFRQLVVPLSAALPLILGLVAAASLAVLIFDSISFFSLAFAALLLGLGIDFAIHIIARYTESRSAGNNLENALVTTLNHTGKALVIGAVTTAVVFAAFLLADFKAFSQMGVICAAGIIFTLLSILIVMPAILAWSDQRRKNLPYGDTEYRWLEPVGRFLRKYSQITPVLVVAVIILNWSAITELKIGTDLRSLFPADLPSTDWLQVVQEDFDYNPDTISLMADDLEELYRKNEALSAVSGIAKTESLLDYMPQDQQFKLDILNDIIERYQKGIANTGFNPLSLEPAQLAELSAVPLIEDLPEELLAFYRSPSGKYLIELTPAQSVWDQESLTALQKDLADAGLGTPTGMPYIFKEVIAVVQNDITKITVVAVFIVALILYIFFRSVRDTFIVIVTIASTILLTIIVSKIVNLEFNIINIAGLPLIIGIGVDSGVHLAYRLRNGGSDLIPDTLVHTGKAIVLTTLTTIIAFGSLVSIGHPGLADFGMIVVTGMAVCLVLTLTLLPSGYALAGRLSAPNKLKGETKGN
jgi:uncharacterized protein